MKHLINQIICGHVMEVLKSFPSDSIDCIVTSPPYWGLRSYGTEEQVWDGDKFCTGDNGHVWGSSIPPRATSNWGSFNDYWKPGMTKGGGKQNTMRTSTNITHGQFCIHCQAWKGELGLEPTFHLYIAHLKQIFQELKRVMKPTGTMWVNLGDSYSGSGGDSGKDGKRQGKYGIDTRDTSLTKQPPVKSHLPNKSLCQIPERFAIMMTDDLNMVKRNTIIWHKRNCMPSSVNDRFTVDFEYLYFFTKKPEYDFEQQFEEYTQPLDRWGGTNLQDQGNSDWTDNTGQPLYRNRNMRPNFQGRNKRCVWDIPTQPSSDDHYAQFPPELVKTPIEAGCPKEICTKCNKARKLIMQSTGRMISYGSPGSMTADHVNLSPSSGIRSKQIQEKQPVGYSICKCNAGFHPGIVLDPFCGTGTTLKVAKALKRNYIGIDILPKYVEIAQKELSEGPLFEQISNKEEQLTMLQQK